MIIGRTASKDIIDDWIGSVVQGRSFIDIGGIGEWATNERCTFARAAGASRVAMADFEPFGNYLWNHYEKELAEAGVSGIELIDRANIDDPRLPEITGEWDVVHSTGILYHVPNPVYSILNIRRVVKRHLILNTVILPNRIENEHGTLTLPDCGVALYAALNGQERTVLAKYYKDHLNLIVDEIAPEDQGSSQVPYMRQGAPSYYPYWWIFTRHSFEALLRMLEMKVLARDTWKDHVHAVFLERV